jgi:hypothetical protein
MDFFDDKLWLIFVMVIVYGVAEGILSTTCMTLVSVFFSSRENKVENAFAILRVVQNAAISGMFV